MVNKSLNILFFLFCSFCFGQEFSETELKISTNSETIQGNLIHVSSIEKTPLVIIIPGSGPTDRNGNNAEMKNNSLKYLAEGLASESISSYRYDKSVLSFGDNFKSKIDSLKFETFIDEAKSVILHFKNSDEYAEIIVAGHSQGSLVGLIAAQENVSKFISIAGPGRPLDIILAEQIKKQAPFLLEETNRVLSELKQGKTVEEFNLMLNSLFNKNVQPFLISWLKYNPQAEIKKLMIPTLIINGSNDLQVNKLDAELLNKANLNSELEIIENMNHILKEIKGDMTENMNSYANPEIPIKPELIEIISAFIKK